MICNQQVRGSSPFTSSMGGNVKALSPLQFSTCTSALLDAGAKQYGGVPEWPKGTDCKSVVSDFGGSNPPSSTKLTSIFGYSLIYRGVTQFG